MKRNAETYSGKLADKPIFTDFTEASKEDQAFVEKLNGRDGGRREAVSPSNPNAETRRAERIAARIGRRIVWVKNLGADGLSDPTIDRNVVFLDPGSNRAAQVLVAHETAHTLAADNPAEFQRLVDFVDHHADQKQVDAFVERMDAAMEPGETPLTEKELKAEFVANLLSDYAYRSHEAAAKAEYTARGGNFTGYGEYLREGTQGKWEVAKILNCVSKMHVDRCCNLCHIAFEGG